MAHPLYIEVTSLLNPKLTGVGRFVARLVEALSCRTPLRLFSLATKQSARLGGLRADLLAGYDLEINEDNLPSCDGDLDRWTRNLLQRRRVPHDPNAARESSCLYTWLRPDTRHFAREMGIYYDFTPLIVPWAHRPDTVQDFQHFFNTASRRFDKAFAISQATKSDARWLTPLQNENVLMGYPGPSLCLNQHAFSHPVERRKNQLLVVSTQEPRKNGEFLIRWFQESPVISPGTELVWAGPKGWAARSSNSWMGHRPWKNHRRKVQFLGMVSDSELCRLYQSVRATIYASLYEGFGFPVLDSLRHETPVLCSFNSSLQEFEGPGVHYFDATDATSLDEAYKRMMGSQMPPIGIDELDRMFSWSALAENIVEQA